MKTPYVFRNEYVTRNIGFCLWPRTGYFRLTYVPFQRWVKSAESPSLRIQRTIDNGGRYWRPIASLGELLEYRWYRLVAYHFSIGPFTASYVRDRCGAGPIGPVWPRKARG